MKVFHCQHCAHLLFFENSRCVQCGYGVAFVPAERILAAIPPIPPIPLEPPGASPACLGADPTALRRCKNDVDFDVCNWTVSAEDAHSLCRSCRLTRVIPDTSRPGHRLAWYRLEVAKRRLIFTLLGLGLSVVSQEEDPARGLAFEFLADPEDTTAPRVVTGHAGGVITVNLAEADDAERERRKQGLGEPFRTLLGHMRHESGHYFWDRLIRDTAELDVFRGRFGDESTDYASALATYYANGPAADWPTQYVTAYASAHPWEDWAETWAHYLHMVDALETAAEHGLRLAPPRPDDPSLGTLSPDVTSGRVSFEQLMESWFPLTYVLNNLNRGLGLPDAYPFVLSGPAIDKLRLVHDVIGRASGRCCEAAG